ncbi:MAG: hypothetical protein HY744_29990 [Deltaproteobacteria bacterium]|nr:hypothetical protein [Deltaproteobacteria bacterium]
MPRRPSRRIPPESAPPLGEADLFLSLHILVYRDGDAWLAHCLEFDAVAQGDCPDEARTGLMDAVALLVEDAREHGAVAGLYRPAPVELWRRFGEARSLRVYLSIAAPGAGGEWAGRLPRTCIEERLVPA